MFHSSSFRHEQYIRSTISNSSKATLHKKRSSLESEGADSGYNSSSSITSPTTDEEDPKHHVTTTSTAANNTAASVISSTISTIDDTTFYLQQQKKKSKSSIKHQPPRQPDLVYSCPRPLAFPFHNDDHFLPIAEADPRDVARVSPLSSSSLLNRSASLNSASSSTRLLKKDTDSSYSRHSSILSSIQRGTVRSLRSLFQLPDTSTSNTTSNNNLYEHSHQKLEIKQGTVQSIKNMFKRTSITIPRTNSTPTSSPPVPPKKGLVSKAISQFESKQKTTQHPPTMGLKVNVTPSSNNRKSTLTQRAKDLKSKLFNKSPIQQQTTTSITALPKPENKTKAKLKNLSQKVFNWKPATAPTPTETNTIDSSSLPKPKKSIFASFKSSNTQDDNKKSFFSFKKTPKETPKKPSVEESEEQPPKETTTVKKMWKGFKNLVTGKKSSRIGIM